MRAIEQSRADEAESPRLTARFAVHWAEHRALVEKLDEIESSTAWAIARRLARLRSWLIPDGSRRQRWFRLGIRGLRWWRRGGIATLFRRIARTFLSRFGLRSSVSQETPKPEQRTPTPRIAATPQEGGFRAAFIGSAAVCEAQSMRYRAHNVIEALALAGIQGTFFSLEEVQANLDTVLSHDLIVLVRLMHNPVTAQVIESARRLGLPIVYDIDDYLFDPWVMPYIEAFRALRQVDALRIMDELGACLHACDYFTGSTSYLAETAARLGKKSFVLPNGLNAAQLRLACHALEQRNARRDPFTRLGYFSGTRTHQADFRIVYPALMKLLSERTDARLLIVGDLDLGEFPGLLPYIDVIETLPIRLWSELPAILANVDINLIPLEVTPFNEGKSNLKYYEAGLLKVPSIASPTRINCENIRPGHNGLLARTPDEWYSCLTDLMSSAERRERMGQNAVEHVLRHYAPTSTGRKAVAIYREILEIHRSRRLAA